MARSLDRVTAEIHGIQRFADRLSQALTAEQAYAFGLSVIQDLFEPEAAFVLLPGSGPTAEHDPNSASSVTIPITARGEFFGDFMIRFDTSRPFTALDLALAELIATQTGLTLHHIREQERLEEAVKNLRDAARRKDESLAMAFHELRSPLMAIVGASDSGWPS